MPLLQIQDASYTYPQSERKALSSINVSIDRGEYIALVGSNGSGKSTLARLMAGFIQPNGADDMQQKVQLADGVLPGIVFQQPKEQIVAGVVSRDTAFGPQNLSRENSYHAMMTKAEIELRTMECLSVTGLLDRASSRTFELSLGQTQRLALSGILALFPDLLILDEVTAMLDPLSRAEVMSLINEWHRKGHTVVHVTHDRDEVLCAQRVIVLDKGRIVFDGSSATFKRKRSLLTALFGEKEWYVQNKRELVCVQKEDALVVNDLAFEYESQPVFANLQFVLKKGTLTALTGPSGCGKSTLLECLAGLLTPQQGTVASLSRPSLALQESEAALFEPFAADDVAFGPRNQGVSGRALVDRVRDAMNLVGLPYETFGERRTFELSGGEKRKLSLAGIIALDSTIMLFDEPTAGLDPLSREVVLSVLKNLALSGKTVLFSTHRCEEADFADAELSWKSLTAGSSCKRTSVALLPSNVLTVRGALPNAELIQSLRRTTNVFMAPAAIPPSPIQSLAPVLKYILFIALFASSLAARPLWLCGIFGVTSVLYAVMARYPLKKPLVGFAKLFPWLVLFSIFQFLFFPAEAGEVLLVHWGIFTVSRSKILMVLCMYVRTFAAILCIGTFVFTMSEREILDGLDDLLKPLTLIKIPVRYVVLVVGIVFRFIPLLLDETAGVLKTQLVRGGLGKAKGFGKVTALLPLFIPLMLQTFRKAEAFADALTARYFR